MSDEDDLNIKDEFPFIDYEDEWDDGYEDED